MSTTLGSLASCLVINFIPAINCGFRQTHIDLVTWYRHNINDTCIGTHVDKSISSQLAKRGSNPHACCCIKELNNMLCTYTKEYHSALQRKDMTQATTECTLISCEVVSASEGKKNPIYFLLYKVFITIKLIQTKSRKWF